MNYYSYYTYYNVLYEPVSGHWLRRLALFLYVLLLADLWTWKPF